MAFGSIKDMFFRITGRDESDPAFASVNRNLRQTDKLAASASEKIGRAGKSMQRFGAAGSVASGSVLLAFRDVIGLYDAQERAEAKVATAVRQTGMAAGFTAAQLEAQASALQDLTRFGDEEILDGVTAQLLTFKNIAGDAFLDAQVGALDLAELLSGDLQSASIMLGKALNDPVKGLSAMSRAGITFSEAQQEVIKNLARSGDLAAAQRVILDEIASAYGGQAEAARIAGAGMLEAWRNTWGDAKEIIGGFVYEALPPLISGLRSVVDWFEDLTPRGQRMTVMLGALAVAIPPVTLALGVMVSAVAALSGPIGIAIAGITGLAAAAAVLWPEKDKVTQSLDLVTAALADEMTQSQLLQQAISGDISMSESAARQKLEEARARLANVEAIHAEKRALGLAEEGRVGVGAMSVPSAFVGEIDAATRRGDAVDQFGRRTPDGRDFFDPRAQADFEGRVTSAGVDEPVFSDDHARDLEEITTTIATLEEAIGRAENGVVSFGNGMVVPIETAERLKQEIRGGGSTGGVTGALSDLSLEVDDLATSESWITLKDSLKALVVEGQSWSDTWQGIMSSALDRVFDLAFSPAWDALFDNLDTYLTKSSATTAPAPAGDLVGGLIGGATNWVGNILGLDTGGDVRVSGKGGVDRNLTVLRTSDAETVSVRRPGDGGMRPVTVNIMTQDLRSFQGSQAQIAGQMRRALSVAERAS